MYSKTQIYNLALGALLLNRRVTNADSEQSNEVRVLNTHWEQALFGTLQDMDLDSTSQTVELELIEENPNDLWGYAYRYPAKCVFLRRLYSGQLTDARHTHIDKRVGMHDGDKVIFTNQSEASAEVILHDVNLATLGPHAGPAIAYRLALLCAPLIVGKGAGRLLKQIEEKFAVAKAQAMAQDRMENFGYVPEEIESEFVHERTSD